MENIQADLLLISNSKNDSSTARLLSNTNNNSNESSSLLQTIDEHSNQITITKNKNSNTTSNNPFSNLFHPLSHHLHVNHHKSNNDSNTLYEYSSESLLQYTKENNYTIVKEILDHTNPLNHSSSDSNFLKHHINKDANLTITSGNAGAVYSTIMSHKKFKIDLEIHDEGKQTPLIIACRNDNYEIASLLIEHGSNVNCKDLDSWTPLLNAARNGNQRLVSLLLEHKAHVDDKDCGGFTPLMWACYKNYLNVVQILLKHGANPNSQCKNLICCLSWAAGRGYTDIVLELLKCPNIKINMQDQNSSTPILWAARKGSLHIVTALVEKGASPELAGMNNMTPLIISCKNGHVNVALYLSKLPNLNVNHIDKDGNTALSIAAKNSHLDVVMSLLEKGAYVNIPNKKGDSILITAVKGGHREIIEALLSKHVEVDAIGNQGKTAMHYAIEKGNIEIVRLILSYKPDLEIVAKDGDTLLLLAVKKKNALIVNELLNSGSKVSATDKNGDNALHISLRNKSREITELILSNPKNSKYLYKPNKEGDTPYKIDASNPKSILTQIFGARQLNMTEDSILGYDLYSGALAEILSEPSLHTPITVGLYAKWGSGKSFLLAQLKAEMKSFARLTRVVNLKLNIFTITSVLFMSLLINIPFFFWKWLYGLGLFLIIVTFMFILIVFGKYFYEKREREWAERLCEKISTQLTRFKLFLRILFLNPFNYKNENIEHKNLRYIFTEYGKISTIGGESALALMISTLNTKMETQLGVVTTRLCRVFYNKTHSHSKYRRFCCIPTFILFIMVIVMIFGVAIFLRVKGFNIKEFKAEDEAFLFTIIFIILLSIIGSSFTWSKILWYLIRSPSDRIMNAVNSKDKNRNTDSKNESYIFKLKREVDLISHTVRTIDAFTHSCTRLVIVIDGLDSCEQSKVLQILEIVHVLFTREGDPFVCIVAVDPHVLIKGIEGNLVAAFRNGNVNGHDYLRTIIHLPVYLQVDLSKAKAIAKMPKLMKRNSTTIGSSQDIIAKIGQDVNTGKKGKKNRKRTATKPMSALDLTDQLIKSEYFSDVNPRNLRRLINIIALTGRLLRAYHIDFNWRILASWIYLNEQWPYRCSWLVMYYEEHEDEFNEESTLNEVYNKVKDQIPTTNEQMLDLDRNVRKFEQFIQNCEPKLTCTILKKILPCTCNLDPYLIKRIKDSIEAREDKLIHFPINSASNLLSFQNLDHFNPITNNNQLTFGYNQSFAHNRLNLPSPNFSNAPLCVNTSINKEMQNMCEIPSQSLNYSNNELIHRRKQIVNNLSQEQNLINLSTNLCSTQNDFNLENELNEKSYLKIDLTKNLSEMSVGDVCDSIMNNIEQLSDDYKQVYTSLIKEKNINGLVLISCDLDELKNELKMTFGDWQLFKQWILYKRQNRLKKPSSNLIIPTAVNKQTSSESTKQSQSQTTLITSQTTNQHGRKVEFYVTPVKDQNDSQQQIQTIKTPTSPTTNDQVDSVKKPLNSILIKQSNLKSKHQTNEEALITNNNNENKDDFLLMSEYEKGENIPLMTRSNNDEAIIPNNHSPSGLNPMTKLGKKLFKSIDNLIHKTERSSRTASSSHDENETDLSTSLRDRKKKYKKNSNDESSEDDEVIIKNGNKNGEKMEDCEEDENETSSIEDDEDENTELKKENLNITKKISKESKRELIKMDSIKKSFIKVKNQLMSDTPGSSSKAELLPIKSNLSPISSSKAAKETNNLNSNTDEKKTTTYLIFDDDDDAY